MRAVRTRASAVRSRLAGLSAGLRVLCGLTGCTVVLVALGALLVVLLMRSLGSIGSRGSIGRRAHAASVARNWAGLQARLRLERGIRARARLAGVIDHTGHSSIAAYARGAADTGRIVRGRWTSDAGRAGIAALADGARLAGVAAVDSRTRVRSHDRRTY